MWTAVLSFFLFGVDYSLSVCQPRFVDHSTLWRYGSSFWRDQSRMFVLLGLPCDASRERSSFKVDDRTPNARLLSDRRTDNGSLGAHLDNFPLSFTAFHRSLAGTATNSTFSTNGGCDSIIRHSPQRLQHNETASSTK